MVFQFELPSSSCQGNVRRILGSLHCGRVFCILSLPSCCLSREAVKSHCKAVPQDRKNLDFWITTQKASCSLATDSLFQQWETNLPARVPWSNWVSWSNWSLQWQLVFPCKLVQMAANFYQAPRMALVWYWMFYILCLIHLSWQLRHSRHTRIFVYQETNIQKG